ncbi:MotA/TolQ/ExbB proton channel family protein [Arcobacter sp. LA11]|uniref:MotA/TolQ/ExbB proton channel family protein n=1 Tax=Arcobacter sp. LA11 TaxID=1898176 RepID=UPI0009351F6E|nr:MotA/TolQ/ExbB proton channel family protein [Arcobacter sp. LA11]
MISLLENLMYEVSNTFLAPILILIVLLFIYSIFEIGVFFTQWFKRKKSEKNYKKFLKNEQFEFIKGYAIVNYLVNSGFNSLEDLEVHAYKKLQNTSIITRVAPMLGLVATMIPMGPALKALSSGNVQGISENLIIAFAAVIFALITASITYWITTVRKGWYAHEIKDILHLNKVTNETVA